MLIIAVLIRRSSSGPALYAPVMLGQNGRPFKFYRFRTMIDDETGRLTVDQRLTGTGRFIRNYSLDHLPSLFNLMNGTLTLVGPRPMEEDRVDWNDPIWRDYFQTKPGLFNFAVLKMGRTWTPSRNSHPNKNQELEVEYQGEQSGVRDFKLVLAYLREFFRSRGNVKARGVGDSGIIVKEVSNFTKNDS